VNTDVITEASRAVRALGDAHNKQIARFRVLNGEADMVLSHLAQVRTDLLALAGRIRATKTDGCETFAREIETRVDALRSADRFVRGMKTEIT
jgi:hypothetical protein